MLEPLDHTHRVMTCEKAVDAIPTDAAIVSLFRIPIVRCNYIMESRQ
jgi:hypothetical protein